MHQDHLSSLASQWLCRYVILTLPGIDELIQITTGSESGMGKSRLWGFEDERRSMDMVVAAEIFDASRLSLFSSLTIGMKICNFDSARD